MMSAQVLTVTKCSYILNECTEEKKTTVLLYLSQHYVSFGSVAGDAVKLKQEIKFSKMNMNYIAHTGQAKQKPAY